MLPIALIVVVVVVMVVVMIMPVVVGTVIAVPRNRFADDGPGTCTHDGAHGSPNGRSSGTSDDRSTHSVLTSGSAGRGRKRTTQNTYENKSTHAHLPFDGCSISCRRRRPTRHVDRVGIGSAA
jgi:hypothetical protein